MTVVREDSFIERTADGVQTDYTFDFPFIEDDDIKVYINGTGIASTEYTLTADPLTGGTIAFNVAPVGGSSVLIRRDTPATQETDYPPYGPFPAESHERALDKLTMLVQEALASSDIIVTTQLKYAGNWSPLTFYDIMNIVWYDNGNGGDYYVCNSSHTSGSTFESQYWNVFIDLDNFWTAHDDALQAAVDAAASAVAADVAATSAGDSAAAAANSQVAAKLSEDNSKQSELNAEESSQRSSDCAAFAFEQAASVNLPLPSTGDADDVIAVNQTQDGWALAKAVMKDSDVGAGNLPVGTEAERPAAPTPGMIRFNSDEGSFEGYNGVEWGKIGGGGLRWVMVTAADSPITAEDGVGYICDTNAGPIAIELPPITEEGLTTGAMDKNGNFVSNGVLFLPNGADTIMGVANLELDEQYQAMTLVSSDSPDGWRIYTITPNSDDDTLQNQIDDLQAQLDDRPRRNLLYNPGFRVNQREISTNEPMVNLAYGLDRWLCIVSGATNARWSFATQSIYGRVLGVQLDAIADTGDNRITPLVQRLEGNDLMHLVNGGTVTLSGYFRSSSTGVHTVKFQTHNSGDVTRTLLKEITINQADTYEYKSVTIDIPAGYIGQNELANVGLQVHLFGWASSTGARRAAPDVWHSTTAYQMPTNAVDWPVSGGSVYVAHLKLEIGDKATPFEPRTMAEELALCQRYYARMRPKGPGAEGYIYTGEVLSLAGGPSGDFQVEMRAVPTISVVVAPNYVNCSDSATPFTAQTKQWVHRLSVSSAGIWRCYNGLYQADAEL